MSSIDITPLIAETYREAALAMVNMRSATEAFESISETNSLGKNCFEVWDAIDDQIGKCEDAKLQHELINLRTRFENLVKTNEVARLQAAFTTNQDKSWPDW